MASSGTVYTCIDYFCVTSEAPKDGDAQQGAHILDIDLRLADKVDGISTKTRRALDDRVHARLADIVTKDKESAVQHRIDAIRANDAGPTRRMWTSFKGLNPRHLTLIGGMDENCYFEPLCSMSTWTRLENICLSGICSPGRVFHMPPFVLRTLKSLNLNYCLDIDLRPAGGAAPTLRLQNLDLHTNDVGWSATMLLRNFPSIKTSLTRLVIHNTVCGYDREGERKGIRRVLTECTKLTDVKLTLRLYHAMRIPNFMPSEVQRLEFTGECSRAFLPLVDEWIECAKNPQWAPNLHFLKFTIDCNEPLTSSRFFISKIRGEDEEDDPTETEEEWAASLPEGITVTFAEPPLIRELFDDNDSLSDSTLLNTGFDADSRALKLRHRPVFRSDNYDDIGDFDDIDLDNLPGIGPHPNHAPRTNPMEGFLPSEEEIEDPHMTDRRAQWSKSVGEGALARFEEAFAAKKQELYKILRDSRASVELID